MRLSFGPILLSLLSCAPVQRRHYDLASTPDSAALAIVSSDSAIFVFPKETRELFRWPTRSPNPEFDKYAWGITILASDTAFLPGGQAYRSAHSAPFSSLAEVVSAARPQLLYNPGGHVQMLDEGARVSMRVSAGRVIVTLYGAAQVQRIFRNAPRTVRFGVVAPLEPLWRQDVVDVQYAHK